VIQQPLSPALRPLFWLAVYLLAAFTIREPLIEQDTYWHLLTGQWILEHGYVPTVDPFTTVGDDRPLIAYSWLFGVLVEWVHAAAGMTGILIGRVLLSLAIVGMIHWMVARRQKSMLAQVLIVGAATVALSSLFLSERPGLFTILFALATLETIQRIIHHEPLGVCWLLPAVYALWANLHIQFVHGLIFIAVAAAGSFLRWLFRRDADSARRVRGFIVLGAACGLAALVNPYGYELYQVALGYGGNRDLYELFEELKPMSFRAPADWAVLGIFLAAVLSMFRRTPDVVEFLLLATSAYFSFHSKHDAWLVVLPSTAILSRWPTAVTDRPLARTEMALIAGGVAVALAGWLRFGGLEEKQREVTRIEFPVGAMQATRPRGPIFVPIKWGGFVAWRTGERVVIDGRAHLHGGPRVRRLINVLAGMPGWHDDPDLRASRSVVVPQHSPLARLLDESVDYRRIFKDDITSVYVPRGE
jgi:hypothetical protein